MSFFKKIAFDLGIGTKIGIASGAGVLLVAAMIAGQLAGNASIQKAKQDIDREQTVVADIINAKASVRGMQIGIRDIRLAGTAEELQRASDYLEARRKSASGFADRAIAEIRSAGRTGDNAVMLRKLIDDYAAGGKDIIAIRADAIAQAAKGDTARAAALDAQAAELARTRTLPIASEMEKVSSTVVDTARTQMKSQDQVFTETMHLVEFRNEIIAGLTMAVLIGMAVFMFFTVVRPIRALTGGMRELASGNFEVVLPGVGRRDEVGGIAAAVDEFKQRLAEKMRLEAEKEQEIARREQAERDERARKEAEAARVVAEVVAALGQGLENLARGNLTYRVSGEFTAEYKKVQEDFNAAIEQLQTVIGGIARSTSEVSSAAVEISSATTDLSQRTEEQAASLEETSASMEEIAVTVKKNAENAQHANELTRNTQEVAGRGGQVVAEAVAAMARIEESSRQISDIISVIDEIARQTNLLALNAAVEAARAGEAGRGFAVVASEVRSLAQRSSQAAKDIKDLIVSSSSQVQDGVELVNRAGASLKEIVESIQSVAQIVGDIATASVEQASGIEQVNKALAQMDEVTQQNSAMVEENAASARTLEQQAAAMDERIGEFRLSDASQTGKSAAAIPMPKPAAAKRPAAVRGARQMQAALATAVAKDDWEEF